MNAIDMQRQFDVAIVIPTTLRPSLRRAVESVFRQDFQGRVQILIGIDIRSGDPAIIEELRTGCPANFALTLVDLGYSTSSRHGGFYSNHYSGAVRTILSYAANGRYVAYLDDDDWWHPRHLSSLLEAIAGKSWAFSLRWFVDAETAWPICEDEWDSLGPNLGINAERFGGFVSPSNLLLDKTACHFVFPYWALSPFADGTGEDRLIFDALLKLGNHGTSGEHTCFYPIPIEVQAHPHHQREFESRHIAWISRRHQIAEIRGLEQAAEDLFSCGESSTARQIAERALVMNRYSAASLGLMSLILRSSGDTAASDAYAKRAFRVSGLIPGAAAGAAYTDQNFASARRWNDRPTTS